MSNFIKTQNSFAHGEVSPTFYTHDNIHGLSRMENMDVLSGGGLSRRFGLQHISDIPGDARLITFSVSDTENYLLVLSNENMWIFSDDKLVANLITPWDTVALATLQYAQRFGTMIFVHPEFSPRVLRRTSNGFDLTIFGFEHKPNSTDLNIPFVRFPDSAGVSISISTSDLGNNYARFTTNQEYWTADHVGVRLLVQNQQWVITQYISSTVVIACVNGTYSVPSTAISDWYECAFGDYRGWPTSITFHQDRLVFGGSKSYPSGIWLSQVGRHHNFDVGTGLDDQAIFITLLSQQRQQICTVVSSENLQILTSVGEWAVSSKPLTPSVIDIKQHTSVGSCASRYLPPQKIEGATIFISHSLQDIRELSLDELGQNYNATDLSAFAKHLMQTPLDLAYNPVTHQLFVVMSGGEMAVLNQNSALGIRAWGTYKTYGRFCAVAVQDGRTYVVVCRDNKFALEVFSASALRDADKYDFAYYASALPLRTSGHNARQIRIRKITARVLNTKSLCINGNRVPLPDSVYSDTNSGFSGDLSVNVLGTSRDFTTPAWTIHGNTAHRATILSVTLHGFYTV